LKFPAYADASLVAMTILGYFVVFMSALLVPRDGVSLEVAHGERAWVAHDATVSAQKANSYRHHL
jgi:hypothetical protein